MGILADVKYRQEEVCREVLPHLWLSSCGGVYLELSSTHCGLVLLSSGLLKLVITTVVTCVSGWKEGKFGQSQLYFREGYVAMVACSVHISWLSFGEMVFMGK